MAPEIKSVASSPVTPLSLPALSIVKRENTPDTPSFSKPAPQRTSSLPRTVSPTVDDLSSDLSQLTSVLQSLLSGTDTSEANTELGQTALTLLTQLKAIAPPSNPKDPLNDLYQEVQKMISELTDTLSASTPSKKSTSTLLSTANTILQQLSATKPQTPSTDNSKGDAMNALVELTIIMVALEIAIGAFMMKNSENETKMGKNEMIATQSQLADIRGQIDAMEEAKKEAGIFGWIMLAIQIVVAVVTAPVDPVGSALMLAMVGVQIGEMEGAIPQNWTGSAVGDLILKIGITIVLSLASCGTAAPEEAAAQASAKAGEAAAEAAEKAAAEAAQAAEKAAAEAAEKAGAAAASPGDQAAAEASATAATNAEKAAATAEKASQAAEKASTAAEKAAQASEKVSNASKIGEQAGKTSKEFKEAEKEAQVALKDAETAAKEAKAAAKDAGLDTKLADDAEQAASKAAPATKRIPLNWSRVAMVGSTLNPLNNAAQLANDDKTKEILTIVFAVITAILAILAAYKGSMDMQAGLTSPGTSILSKLTPQLQETITQILLKITSVLNLASAGMGIGTGMINYKKGQIQEEMAVPMKNFTVLTLLAKMWDSQMKQSSAWQDGENDDFIQWNSLFADLAEAEAAAAQALKA
ncbi:MAG: hypothetical protein JSS32_08100 [Verrucomicrobia bacterium]|nr:hypothetical protein [Verrucomicrobiota bacterium]